MLLFLFFIACNTTDENSVSKSIVHLPNSVAQENRRKIVILGDSLAAGFGLPEDQAFPNLLNAALESKQYPIDILNAGVSGDTTAGGLNRLDWILSQEPDLVVIELGANDGMRGIPISEMKANLESMILKIKAAKVDVMLGAMQLPPNYGSDYVKEFADVYPELAAKHQIQLLPFVLDKVAGKSELNQADGIHPTAEGHRLMADNWREPLAAWRDAQTLSP